MREEQKEAPHHQTMLSPEEIALMNQCSLVLSKALKSQKDRVGLTSFTQIRDIMQEEVNKGSNFSEHLLIFETIAASRFKDPESVIHLYSRLFPYVPSENVAENFLNMILRCEFQSAMNELASFPGSMKNLQIYKEIDRVLLTVIQSRDGFVDCITQTNAKKIIDQIQGWESTEEMD